MRVIMMFRNKKSNQESKYKSFEDWANDTLKKLEEMEQEKQEENKKTTYESKNRPTVFRKFSDNKDVDEKFPRPENKKQSQMDKKSHEGKVNSKGSIESSPMIGREGDPINPDLRKRLEQKKLRELREKREKKAYKNDVHYKRKNVKDAEKHEKITSYKKDLKNKENFKRAIIISEILAPPLAKRKKF